jgi:hypothetical protein
MRLKELNNKNEKTEDAEDNEEPENLSTKSWNCENKIMKANFIIGLSFIFSGQK